MRGVIPKQVLRSYRVQLQVMSIEVLQCKLLKLSTYFFYFRVPLIGLAVTSLLMLGSIIVTGVFSSVTSQQPQALGVGAYAK